jgi:hypothetical protein
MLTDMGRGMITRPIWKYPCIKLFITYYGHLKLGEMMISICSWLVLPLVEQELLTLPEHLSSPPVFSGVFGTRSLVLCVCFVDRCTLADISTDS